MSKLGMPVMLRRTVMKAMSRLGIDVSLQCMSAKTQAGELKKTANSLLKEASEIVDNAGKEFQQGLKALTAQRDAKLQNAKTKETTAQKNLATANELLSAVQLFSNG